MKKFPESFLFGASTSSHQVEGNCSNDWTRWEKQNAYRLAHNCRTSLQPCPSGSLKTQGLNPDNYISGIAADHYNRYDEDFRAAKKIGLNAYRFSVEWSRVEPDEGRWNIKELDHYLAMVKSMRSSGLEPFVTIWHWTLPLWLADSGGVMNKRFPEYFSRYAAKVAQHLGNNAQFYIIINEPEVYSLNCCFLGTWPPQKKGFLNYFRSMRSLIRSHRLAYGAMKTVNPGLRIGTACNMSYTESAGGPLNFIAARVIERLWNRHFTDSILPAADFLGVNYYFHNRIRYGLNKNENAQVSDMGWELFPEGIYHILTGLKSYGLPLYVTESGLADAEDSRRGPFIHETLEQVYRAFADGADVRGYFHWSLLDNFEWDKGFWPQFGLIHVNRKTMKRTIRPSAAVYTGIIKRGLE